MKRLLATTVLAILFPVTLGRADEVVIKAANNQELKQTGIIASDDVDGITLNIAGGMGQQVFKLHEIVRAKVKYECLMRHYDVGRSFENSKEYDLAIGKYDDAVKDPAVPKYAKQYALLRIAVCYERQGAYDQAAVAYKKVLEEMPKTCFAREVAEGQFNCFIKSNKWDEAAKSLKTLETMGEDGRFLALVYGAELLERKAEAKEGEFSKAADAYRAVVKGQPAPEVLCKAQVGAARCLLMDGRAEEAAELAKKVLAVKGCPPAAAADAHEVIGEGLLAGLPSAPKELEQDRNRERALDAIEEMMRPVLQYKGSAWAEQRAYFFVGLWAGYLSAAGVIPAQEWNRRSNWAYRELKAKYPNSTLLQKIK
jgi:tetratricopeptide (TPR) repeat protein